MYIYRLFFFCSKKLLIMNVNQNKLLKKKYLLCYQNNQLYQLMRKNVRQEIIRSLLI